LDKEWFWLHIVLAIFSQAHLVTLTAAHKSIVTEDQGDRNGRIFAYWAVLKNRELDLNLRNFPW
jgi:hypothetical protein